MLLVENAIALLHHLPEEVIIAKCSVCVQVERQLCRSFNFLTHVLSAYTFLSIRYSTAKVESSMIAAAAAYKQDIADLEQNLSSIAGSVDQVNQQLQQHREQLQATVWPALQALGVHLGQLNVLDGKVDAVSTQISGIDQQVGAVAMQVSEIMSYLQQHMPCAAVSSSRPAAKPDMLILQENIQLVGSKPLGQGSFGTVYKAQYDHEDVAVKTFFLGGATDEDMKQVRLGFYFPVCAVTQPFAAGQGVGSCCLSSQP